MKTLLSKTLLIIALATVGMTACKDRNEEKRIAEMEAEAKRQNAENPKGPFAKFEFATITHDFGTINEGDSAVFVYDFKNVGEAPLIIESVKPQCGCTIPDQTKTPVAVGSSGYVKVKFDSNGKSGKVHKEVTVTANTSPPQMKLSFEATINPKAGNK